MPKQGFISASKCGVLLKDGTKPENAPFGVGAITYAGEIAQQIIGVKQEEEYTSFQMERGNELEWEALRVYEERNLVKLHGEQQWAVHPEFEYFGGTPDGRVGSVGGVDVKAPNNNNHYANIRRNEQISTYYDQLQAYMFIFGADWWDLASYNPNYPEPLDLHEMRLLPDPKWQKKMRERLPLFWAIIQREVEFLREKLNQ
jgi:hypothetical protein